MNKIIDRLDLHKKISSARRYKLLYQLMFIMSIAGIAIEYYKTREFDIVWITVSILVLTIISWISTDINDLIEVIHEIHEEGK